MENKSRSHLITTLYHVFRVAFWLHLAIVAFLLLFNYVSYDSKDGLYFTMRGNIYAYDANYKPAKGEMLDTIGSKPIYFLNGQRVGFTRIDYTDLSKAFTLPNMAFTLSDILSFLLWLCITWQLMKILQSMKTEAVFNLDNIRRIKLIGWIVILIPLISFARERLFLSIVKQHLDLPGYILYSNFHYYDLLPSFSLGSTNNSMFPMITLGIIILVIVQIFKSGLELQKETDLTI